jgi:hypothetical protein
VSESQSVTLTQQAVYPEILSGLVSHLKYKDGWVFYLQHLDRGQGSKGLTFVIQITVPDSYHPGAEHHCAALHDRATRSLRQAIMDALALGSSSSGRAARSLRVLSVRRLSPIRPAPRTRAQPVHHFRPGRGERCADHIPRRTFRVARSRKAVSYRRGGFALHSPIGRKTNAKKKISDRKAA